MKTPRPPELFPPVASGEAAPVPVALAIVVRSGGGGRCWVLAGRRPRAAHLPGLWEFPGGKIRPGESGADCAVREAAEETGVRVEVVARWPDVPHRYPDRAVRLEVYLCRWREGSPQPLGCEAVRWVRPENLPVYRFPAANQPLLHRLRRAAAAGARARVPSGPQAR